MSDESSNMNRRSFIYYAAAALALPVVGLGAIELTGLKKRLFSHPSSELKAVAAPWRITIPSANEPGQPLIVSGTIYAPDGRTPLEGISLWVYHTDATGHYSTEGTGNNRNTRLHGQMTTNAEGHYEFRTIKPVAYPGQRIPAHIHAYVSGPGYPEYWIDEYLFDDDPFVTEEVRSKHPGAGSFASILKLTRGNDGVLRGVRDIKIERCSNNCTGH